MFGPATEDAVKTYQRIFGLNPNGIVAAATWSAIADTYNDLMLQNEA
ncbi:MAG: peptidoglycan-binding domain-containing protein [Lachnospiraceae bacterium]